MFKPKKLNQKGAASLLVVPLVLLTVAVIALSVVAVMYYNQYVTQRDKNEPVIAKAVDEAKTAQKAELEADFTEREKQPLKVYVSPAEVGSVNLKFSKVWSSYVDVQKAATMDFYAHPNFVPASGVSYALRMSVVRAEYSTELKKYDAQVKKGELKATSVAASGVTGARLDGFLEKDKEGSMVIFPLRDKTLRVWTESKDFRGDFDNIVLKNLTFVP
jgi:hypothetical protein